MAGRVIFCVVALAMVVPAVAFAGPKVFSVQPSTSVQSANLGFEKGRLTPYVGLDVLAIGVDAKYNERDEWSDGSWDEDSTDISGSAVLMIPTFGVRYALSNEELQPYLFGSLFKSLAFVRAEGKEVHSWGGPGGSGQDVDDYELDDEEEEIIKELLGVWGFDFGFGAEYPFSEHFSVAGQYGLRLFFVGADYKDSNSSNGQQQWREEWKEELSATIGLTHAEMALRFTF